MRILAILTVALILTGCDYGFTFHPEDMTPDQMLDRADLVFIGVIEEHHFDSWPFFAVNDIPARWKSDLWRPLRRRVRVETLLRGADPGPVIDVYEIFLIRGANGSVNSTSNNGRYLFLVRKQGGRWQIVRDYFRSIERVGTGYHAKLPLDEKHSFWERYDLMNYWVGTDQKLSNQLALLHAPDPDADRAIGLWREIKLVRGLVSHPQRQVREYACLGLYARALGLNDCLRTLSQSERLEARLPEPNSIPSDRDSRLAEAGNRLRDLFDANLFGIDLPVTNWRHGNIDFLRVLTTVDGPTLHREFCQKFLAKFPHDTDNGCLADKPLPATIVTENGDVPLIGAWPN